MKITGKTRVIGIIGWPVTHSLSPVMHNAAFEYLDLDFCYVPLGVKEGNLGVAIRGVPALNIAGINVTIPYKESVLPYLSETSVEAKMIGAVNTIKVVDDRLIGYNTDGMGFTTSLKEVSYTVSGHSILILGGGGAAKAVAFQSAAEGAREITIANRTINKAMVLKEQIENCFPSTTIKATGIGYHEIKGIVNRVDIVVNATSIGLKRSDPSPIPKELLHPELFICDLIYNPPETALIEYAKELGCKYINGIGMLLHQGGGSFKIWTGVEPPLEVMKKALEGALKKIYQTSDPRLHTSDLKNKGVKSEV